MTELHKAGIYWCYSSTDESRPIWTTERNNARTIHLAARLVGYQTGFTLDSVAEIAEELIDITIYMGGKAAPFAIQKLDSLGFNGNFEAPQFDDSVYDASDGFAVECTLSEDGTRNFWGIHLAREEVNAKDVTDWYARLKKNG